MQTTALPPETRIGHVRMTVADLDRARAFYAGTLGFAILEQRDRRLCLGAPNSPALIVLDEWPGARPKPPRTTGLYHFAILLPARADLGRVIRQFVESQQPVQGASDHGVSEALYLADPDGNGIEIYSERQIASGRACPPARASVTCTCTSAAWRPPRRFTATRSVLTSSSATAPAPRSCRPAATTTTWA